MGTVLATVIILAGLIGGFIWTRSANRKVGGKCSRNEAGCATCDDDSCLMSPARGKSLDADGRYRYDAVFFDLDGTLLNTSEDLTEAMNHIRTARGLEMIPKEDVIPRLGNGIINLLHTLLPEGISDDDFKACYEEFTEYYADNAEVKTYAYKGMKPLLAEIKAADLQTAVITNKNDSIASPLTDSFFHGLIDFTLGRTDFLKRKPDTAMMKFTLSKLELSPEKVLYVGDSEVDFKFASDAGVDCVLVGWGFRTKEELAELTKGTGAVIINTPEELYDIVGL